MVRTFEKNEIYKDDLGIEWVNLVEGNSILPHIWRQGWMRVETEQPDQTQPLTLDEIKTRHFVSEALGVAFAISPGDTYVLSLAANLPPIADGKDWKPGLNLAAGTIVTHAGQNYIVREGMGHISQSTWSPDLAPALFERMREAYAEWVQPQGAHDAYMIGDVVMHGGVKWRSTHDNNVWIPGVFGWEVI